MPRGSYISWGDQGSRLLSREDVEFLATETNAALEEDAQKTTTVIRSDARSITGRALSWQQAHDPAGVHGRMDRRAGLRRSSNGGVPILSVTRTEYLPKVDADMLILQTPTHLDSTTKRNLERWRGLRKAARPIRIRAHGNLTRNLAKLAGISGRELKPGAGIGSVATLGPKAGGLSAGVPDTFPLYQPKSENRSTAATRTIYAVNGSPTLTLGTVEAASVVFWDPADLYYEAFQLGGHSDGRADGQRLPLCPGSRERSRKR